MTNDRQVVSKSEWIRERSPQPVSPHPRPEGLIRAFGRARARSDE